MKRKAGPPTSVLVGNCRVHVPIKLQFEQNVGSLKVKVPRTGDISISVEGAENSTSHYSVSQKFGQGKIAQGKIGTEFLSSCSFVLLNPKSLDTKGHSLLQEVVKLYNEELPAMRYAANTGKESPFVEKCVSTGKYCTLLLKHQNKGDEMEVVGAVTYQILPPDTQYAEIPLAAVTKEHQRKGYGAVLYKELQRRLQAVGVLTVFCWGDQESEHFWTKLGFLMVAEVDGRGKPRKLPIKPDVRRAMSIPGSATLMVFHMSGHTEIPISSDMPWIVQVATPVKEPYNANYMPKTSFPLVELDATDKSMEASPAVGLHTPKLTEPKPLVLMTPSANKSQLKSEYPRCQNITPLNISVALLEVGSGGPNTSLETTAFDVAEEQFTHQERDLDDVDTWSSSSRAGYGNTEMCAATNGIQIGEGHETASHGKRNINESENCRPVEEEAEAVNRVSMRLLTRPGRGRGRGGGKGRGRGVKSSASHDMIKTLRSRSVNKVDEVKHKSIGLADMPSLDFQESAENLVGITARSIPEDLTNPIDKEAEDSMQMQPYCGTKSKVHLATENYQIDVRGTSAQIDQCKHVIMFMNMANAERRLQLSKFVENLGGTVTHNGSDCTHVITGEVRRTFNFCAAICAGAWVVSPEWLKASVKSNTFVDESLYILKDIQFEQKYKTSLEATVKRAKLKPRLLFDGFSIYVTCHVQPPIESIQQLILIAGGKVLFHMQEAVSSEDLSHTFIIACEEDMSEALSAAKEGVLTYTSEWFMSSVMKQELDLTASQFTESLQ